MHIRERYRKTFSQYYEQILSDEVILQGINQRCSKSKKSIGHRWAVVSLASIILILSTTYVFASVGWLRISDIFRSGPNDPISANLVDKGIVQELDAAHENDAFALKLIAFTGDTEIQKALFALKPKKDLGPFDEIRLAEKSLPAEYIESYGWDSIREGEVAGSRLTTGEADDVYYFNYTFPPYWMQSTTGDMVIRVLGIRLYKDGKLSNSIDCDFSYRFTPDRSILPEPVKVTVNRIITKDTYDEMSFTSDYGSIYLHRGEIVSPTTRRAVMITKATFTQYKARIYVTIPEEDISESEASKIRHQFTQPRFLTHHYWAGLDKPEAFDLAVVENMERIRLFVDGAEQPMDEASLDTVPDRDSNGEHLYYSFHVEYEGFDYEKAKTVEIRFGDEVIVLK